MLRSWLELSRVSNLPTVWTNVLVAWLLAGGQWLWQPLAWLLVGGSLLYTGGMILNDAADVKYDRAHRQERPIPSGRVSAAAAWMVGLGMMAAGFGMFIWGAEACGWLTGALAVAILGYDLYHKPWAGSVFVMGSCRTLLYLAAGSAVTGSLNWTEHHELMVKAVALGGYIVGLSLCARNEATAHRRPPGRGITLESAVGLFGLFLPVLTGLAYSAWHRDWLAALPAGVLIVVVIVALGWMRGNPKNIGKAVGLLLAAIPAVDGVAVAPFNIIVAVICLALIQPLRLWQRKIAAT